MEDVVQAAVAEVEDYARVRVTGSSPDAVDGAVAADVVHLLAELIENAAAFSPPTAEVTITFATVSQGLAIEVVDRGAGLHPLERAELNRRLSCGTEFDLADTERLGLFVVARLARRHEIGVELEPSPYGGTTAAVLIPGALVAASGSEARAAGAAKPAKPPAQEGQRLGRPNRPAPGARPSEPLNGVLAASIEPAEN
ncbi:sensor histidine kinase [Actinomadura opuntiae]|uniref:sensor histidine kinase n=1 Tax=Actinomadura sp. OS1-43 TaxID=604315 RepID=UPI00255A7521|nr:ATP-binding protein [Actinomadura sp. OS1-43]MDL4817173.1 ATP-binding protein [Actinomadura sp. OS1-43]